MRKKTLYFLTLLASLSIGLSACNSESDNSASSDATSSSQTLSSLEEANSQKASEISKNQTKLDQEKASLAQTTSQADTQSEATPAATPTQSDLASLDFTGEQEITVNNNDPAFSTQDLSLDKGAWTAFSDLDHLNRVGAANALLNKSLMPTAKRSALTWNPTGWHNKRTNHGWLYNRSHLIGYQLSGENNNPKNLMTGTTSLNTPEMLHHEMDIAYFLKQSPDNYVRYEVHPIFRGDELLARGVQMRAQSVGSDKIHFNVYIFNVQTGYTLNYNDGTSQKQ
ncbi:DNA-entry nuclease [Agrilactobacillus composti DSM 18527 = JCM 14202]|uniref:DNA-entry nuclease n=1 Tax=Agrilactobacillus composti DSM 18527 = JCM 14202 TaxID=1423734 RepID=A0A0R1XQD7_9LACO|nr:DNA/RNA non-specific endonuclease [Agrilactobacillus composti]KRM30868.1 DNA-entry nuclease [Agrilactobacillus composti DSM 18527 = JCM 14202]